MTDYAYAGDVIKLNYQDYFKWQQKFTYLNLDEELELLDMEFEARQREGKKVKNWFSECIPRLNGRNKRAKNFGGVNGQRKQSLAERTELQTRQILSNRAAREASVGYVGQNGTAIRPQVGFQGGREADRGGTFDGELFTVVPEDEGPNR